MEDALANTLEQVPFGGAEFAENPEPQCPCILLLEILANNLVEFVYCGIKSSRTNVERGGTL
jgi:hypothetical protein